MAEPLIISLVQSDTVWEDVSMNLERLSLHIEHLKDDTDMIVLPELFSTGFTMNAPALAESMSGRGVSWMLEVAETKNCLVIGSLLIEEAENYYNRLIVAFPEGHTAHYDKRHLFSFAGEDKVFTAGKDKLIFEYKGFRICPFICYDLRFPVWARNTEEVDLMIFVANWPNARMIAWDTLLKARAIENLCYVIGVNRVGKDNNNLIYTGHSAVYDALGDTILTFESGMSVTGSLTIDHAHIELTRKQFRFLEDRDRFEIK